MTILEGREFDSVWRNALAAAEDAALYDTVRNIIRGVRLDGDSAVRGFSARFDLSVPPSFEIDRDEAGRAWDKLVKDDRDLASALEESRDAILRFAREQKKQIFDFEFETAPGLITGQKVIPVDRAAVYVPGGRFPLISTVLMGAVPAKVAGVGELVLASPPRENGLPDERILAAAHLAGVERIFAVGGAQAVAALALGTETIPRVDMIVGPGNKYVAAAKRLLFGEVGIDFVAGPTDVLVIVSGADRETADTADLIAADLVAQAEHDPDARARALLPSRGLALAVEAAVEKRLALLPNRETARVSLETGGLLIVYADRNEALAIANRIAPEHLELFADDAGAWVPSLRNYGSLFIGSMAAEVLGDYSAGINHTLPTSTSARFTGGLSVRHFLKVLTTLRCHDGPGYDKALAAAQRIALAEGLSGHAGSAAARLVLPSGEI